ncbi:hypothetical protein [Flavobacterium sp. FlaQc-48]|uniref:hypothetical protein n=1 Tax=Flavobacterium sp. FlaQc-48 TaxID=3374181 RepID=UPI00375735AA
MSANTTSGSGLQFFPTSEGYFDTINQKYVFQYKDHLGNVRVSTTKVGSRVNSPIQSNIKSKEAFWARVSALEAINVWVKSFF